LLLPICSSQQTVVRFLTLQALGAVAETPSVGLTAFRPTGATTDNTYDALNRLQSVTHKDAIDAVMAAYAYTRYADGRIEDVQESNGTGLTGTAQYDYDELGRLTLESYNGTATGTDYTTSYTLDIVGNRLTMATTSEDGHVEQVSGQFDDRDRLLHDDTRVNGMLTVTVDYGYDASGSLTSRTASDGSTAAYTFDLRNHLSGATITGTDGGVWVVHGTSYVYNDAGIRVRTTDTATPIGGTSTTDDRLLLIDTNNPTGYAQVVEERAPGSILLASFVYGLEPLSQSQAGTVSHYLLDGHSGVRLLLDAANAIIANYRYDAFGTLVAQTGTNINPLLYRGERLDPVLGEYYLRARFYDPATGRFNGLDPFTGSIVAPQSLHKYLYAHGDPMTNLDPSGESIWGWFNSPGFRGLARRVGARIALAILVGAAVHHRLSRAYRTERGFLGVYTNSPIFAMFPFSTLVGAGVNTGLRPDIVDIPRAEIYEIKPLGLGYGPVQNAVNIAERQIFEYLAALVGAAQGGPQGIVWPPLNPGITWHPRENLYHLSPVDYPYLPIGLSVIAWQAAPGVIVYVPGPEFVVYVAAVEIIMARETVRRTNAARGWGTVAGAFLIAAFGVV
jgi:RHS repeat-associated protein